VKNGVRQFWKVGQGQSPFFMWYWHNDDDGDDDDGGAVQSQQNEVRDHCVNAEPHHGELWCSVSKAINNWRLKTNDILPLAASTLQIPT